MSLRSCGLRATRVVVPAGRTRAGRGHALRALPALYALDATPLEARCQRGFVQVAASGDEHELHGFGLGKTLRRRADGRARADELKQHRLTRMFGEFDDALGANQARRKLADHALK